jgi:hypothetical protein
MDWRKENGSPHHSQPGEVGYETWEDSIAYKNIGGINCWSGFSMDEKRGIVSCRNSASPIFMVAAGRGKIYLPIALPWMLQRVKGSGTTNMFIMTGS